MHRTSQQPKRQQVGSIVDKSGTKNSEIISLRKVCVCSFDWQFSIWHAQQALAQLTVLLSPDDRKTVRKIIIMRSAHCAMACHCPSYEFMNIEQRTEFAFSICEFGMSSTCLCFFLNESIRIFIWMDLIKFNLHRNTDRKKNLREYAVHVTYCDEFINFCCCHLMLRRCCCWQFCMRTEDAKWNSNLIVSASKTLWLSWMTKWIGKTNSFGCHFVSWTWSIRLRVSDCSFHGFRLRCNGAGKCACVCVGILCAANTFSFDFNFIERKIFSCKRDDFSIEAKVTKFRKNAQTHGTHTHTHTQALWCDAWLHPRSGRSLSITNLYSQDSTVDFLFIFASFSTCAIFFLLLSVFRTFAVAARVSFTCRTHF